MEYQLTSEGLAKLVRVEREISGLVIEEAVDSVGGLASPHSGHVNERSLSASSWSVSAIVLWEVAKLAQLGRIDVDLEDAEGIRTVPPGARYIEGVIVRQGPRLDRALVLEELRPLLEVKDLTAAGPAPTEPA